MIPDEEVQGLLTEAEYAERTGHNGGMVLLTPQYTRHLVKLLTISNTELDKAVEDFASDWNSGMIDRVDDVIRSAIFWVIEDRFNEVQRKPYVQNA